MKSRTNLLAAALLVAATLPLHLQAARDFGPDVSHFQGETGIAPANWNQMFAEGKRFVFVKATESLSVLDGTMTDNMNRATAAGFRAGVYHFAHPEARPTTSGAIQEADFFLAAAGNFIGPGYLRPVLDLEVGSTLTTTALTDWVIAFANEIITHRGPGAAPIIYTLQSFANNELDSRLANYDLWIRTVSSGADPAVADPPGQGFATSTGVFNNWSFWQYDIGSSGGISPLDLNVCHNEFKSLDSFLIPVMVNPSPPAVATQPQSRTIRVGTSASLAVTPTLGSSTPLSYQWRFSGTNLPGATASAYARTNAQLAHSGNYAVVITNVAGSVTSAVAVLTVLNPPPAVPGLVLYQQNFDDYSSESVVTSPGTVDGFKLFFAAATGPTDFTAKFGFDYSAVSSPIAIPSAPHSSGGTTKGLSLTVNKDSTSALTAVNLYPVSQTFTGNFALRFDVWLNFPNISSATEHALFGINHSGNLTNRISQIASDGLFFGLDSDGAISAGSTTVRDFPIYRGGGPAAAPVLLTPANTTFGPQPLLGANFDNADAGFSALFPSKSLPGFNTAAGAAGNGWVNVEVRQAANLITWLLNDTLVAQFANTTTFTNGNILIGYYDPVASAGGAANFAVFDNIRVETLPDLDGNGLADDWEIQYFGQTGTDPDADPDGDRATNLMEYQSGTIPTNAASAFRILNVARTNNNLRLDSTTAGGHSYVVQLATNVSRPMTNFTDLAPAISVGGAGEGTTNFVHAGAATNSTRYYRVRLGP